MVINPMRLTGLATGMDTDSMVKQMMQPFTMRIDKLKQDRQIVQWKQDLFRGIIGNVGTFKRNYFDVLKTDKYMLSANSVSAFKVEGLTDNSVNVKASATAKTGNYEVTVTKLAESAELVGSDKINTVIAGQSNYGIKIDNSNNSYTVNGTGFSLDLDAVKGYNKYSNLSELASAINIKMSSTEVVPGEKLSDKVKAVVKDDSIQFMELVTLVEDKDIPANSNNKISFNYLGKDYEATIAAGKYTADELVNSINSKLSGLTSNDGTTTFPAGKTITSTTDGLGTAFQIDGVSININDGKAVNINPKAEDVTTTAISTGTDSEILGGISLKYKNEIIAGFNDSLNIRVGSSVKAITLTPQILNSSADLKTEITNKLNTAGITAAQLSLDINAEGKVVFNSTSGDQISFYGNASSVFGGYDNFEVNMSGSTKLSDLSQFNGKKVNFIINGVEFKYDFNADTNAGDVVGAKNKTIDQFINEINSKAGVAIKYSTASKTFTIASTATGASTSLEVQDKTDATFTGEFIKTLFGTSSSTKTGADAQIEIKGPNGTSTYLKPQNTFEIDGVSYTFNAIPTSTVKFSLTQNTDDAFNKIVKFIDDYNNLIGGINAEISEKRQYTYKPLTDEQKKDMSETDIKNWEEKTKDGLLRNDSDLSNMLNTMRRAFFDGVEGVGLSLQEIGLNTSVDYSEKGKIVIDEAKLKEALKNNGEKVADLLTKKSTSIPRYDGTMNSTNRATRYNEEGIFQRISDILEDYTRTTSGKGILLNKAGIKGDFTDNNNILSEDLKRRDEKIREMEEKLYDRENRYYRQFAQLEKAIQQMNSQSSWLAQQLGTGN